MNMIHSKSIASLHNKLDLIEYDNLLTSPEHWQDVSTTIEEMKKSNEELLDDLNTTVIQIKSQQII